MGRPTSGLSTRASLYFCLCIVSYLFLYHQQPVCVPPLVPQQTPLELPSTPQLSAAQHQPYIVLPVHSYVVMKCNRHVANLMLPG